MGYKKSEPITLRKIGHEAVAKWDLDIKKHNIGMMLGEGTVYICPTCNERLTWSPEKIMDIAHKRFGEDKEKCLQFYWSRVGWCEGHKFEMAARADNRECHVCYFDQSMY